MAAELSRNMAQWPTSQSSAWRSAIVHSSISDDPALIRVIHRMLNAARDAGRDHGDQTREAVAAIRQIRPDIHAHEALTLVELAWE